MTAQLKILLAAVAVAVLLTPIASAGETKNAAFKGEIVGLEPTFGSGASNVEITIKILEASRWGRGTEGDTVTFVADDETRIHVSDRNGDGEADLSDIQLNDEVRVIARAPEGEDSGGARVWSGIQITNYPAAPTSRP